MRKARIPNLNVNGIIPETENVIPTEIADLSDGNQLVQELNDKQDTLTAGTNITIDANNVISASGGLTEVTASDVNSETATQGQVLTADGNGGASWQNASGGAKLYRHTIISSRFNNLEFATEIINNDPTLINTRDLLKAYVTTNGNLLCQVSSSSVISPEISYLRINSGVLEIYVRGCLSITYTDGVVTSIQNNMSTSLNINRNHTITDIVTEV